MSVPKFTPGPWIAAWDHGAISRADSICHIYPVDGAVKGLEISSVHLARPGTTEEANAHLIAAAPDLYAFAEEFIEAWADGMAGDSALLDKARAALARAMGEQA